jgi:hypothetical protein
MRKKTQHTARMVAVGPKGEEYELDTFDELVFTDDGEGGETITIGDSYTKTKDGLDVQELPDGTYKIVSTGVKLKLKGPAFVTPMVRIGDAPPA